MNKLIVALLVMAASASIAHISGGAEFKGSHTGYDPSAEDAILNMVESQTDPETEKVNIGGMALKFDYFDNNFFPDKDGRLVGSVHLSDNDAPYVFDYYVEGDRVVKIILYTKGDKVINRQVYPEKEESVSD